jgi:cytochrome bd ubiquinol oxidase subunit II
MAEFWAAVLALTLLLYVLLDGFDLGVGILLAAVPHEHTRRQMIGAISPVWDGNETWLVISAAILFGAFPMVYALLLSAFYLPLLVMLAAVILRGVAFEFRARATRTRCLWDGGFICGSYAATFVQGMTVGALVQVLPVRDGRYVGGPFGWVSLFAVLCGFGLCLGYALLGSAWFTYKTTGDARDLGYRMLPRLVFAVLAFLVVAFAYSLILHLQVLDRWLDRPFLGVFPVIGLGACAGLLFSTSRRIDRLPFAMAALLFIAAFATMAFSFLPYMVPFSITIAEAAAPPSSLSFLFWGAGVVVLPITLLYTIAVYLVFRGKTAALDEYLTPSKAGMDT